MKKKLKMIKNKQMEKNNKCKGIQNLHVFLEFFRPIFTF